jgi:hypothetical protein
VIYDDPLFFLKNGRFFPSLSDESRKSAHRDLPVGQPLSRRRGLYLKSKASLAAFINGATLFMPGEKSPGSRGGEPEAWKA